MAMNLLRLGRLLDNEGMIARAAGTISLFISRVASHPVMMPLMAAAALMELEPPRQIVIVASDDADDTARLVRQAQSRYAPGTALVLLPTVGADPWLLERMPTIEGMTTVDGNAVAYVCENFTCERPVTQLP